MDDEHPQARDGEQQVEPDFGRVEPAHALATVEQHLQRCHGQRQHAEAEEVKLADLDRRVGHQRRQHEEGDDTDRQVDEEHSAPVERLGQPAAQRRPDDRPEHDAGAEDRHGLPELFARVDVHHRRLRQRHQHGAAHALDDAERHHLRKVGGDAAEQRGGSEPHHGEQQQVAPAEAVGEPAGQGRRDGRGDDVGGQHPVDFVLRRTQAGAHMGQGDVGDRGVEHLHDHRHHDGGGEKALVLDDDRGGRDSGSGGHFTAPSGLRQPGPRRAWCRR